MAAAAAAFNVDYERETETFRHFLDKFTAARGDDDLESQDSSRSARRRSKKQNATPVHKYRAQLVCCWMLFLFYSTWLPHSVGHGTG